MAEEPYETLNLSKQSLKKINKATENEAKTLVTLILDDNDLQRLDCIDSYLRLENLSIAKNNLVRMHGVSRLTCLRDLNLNSNSILTIEGLKELIYLKKLSLSGNNIKTIEHLNSNINLEYLDLSDNQISHISDISYLKNLKHLNLGKNRIGNLKQCERYLPTSLITFELSNNFLTDLNTLCHLAHFEHIEKFSIEGNPCITSIGHDKLNFDYRPFVINWIMSIKILDGYEVNAIESLKAEWLYSQGKGRQFREGEHVQLVQYLASTCPVGDEAPETEDQRKLRLILSKAQHHQQQLREQGPSSPRPKQSPRMHARIIGRITKSPDRTMSSSYHSALSNKHHNLLNQQSSQMSASFSGEIPSTATTITKSNCIKNANYSLMSQSFDSSSANSVLNSESVTNKSSKGSNSSIKDDLGKTESVNEVISVNSDNNENDKKNVKSSDYNDTNKPLNQPLEAASKMVPVPDSLMSPDYQGPLFNPQHGLMTNSLNRRMMPAVGCQINSPSNFATNQQKNSIQGNISSVNQTISYESPLNKNGKTPTKSSSSIVSKSIPQHRNKGSPQLSRSTMSSPKMRHNVEKRKSTTVSKPISNTEEVNTISSKSNITNSLVTLNGSTVDQGNTSDDDSEMCIEKLQSIRVAADQRRKKQSISDTGSSENVMTSTNKSTNTKAISLDNAAVTIQKLWRGYRIRNLNQKTGKIMHSIQTMRARQYIEKLSCDMEATKAALDSERKIQQLQMQAINALWKKISAMENGCKGNENNQRNLVISEQEENRDELDMKDLAVRELTQTCSMLQTQVQQLQGSMRDILMLVSNRGSAISDQWLGGVATQTEISAVHTPQGEPSAYWPYQKAVSRPSSLSLSVQNSNFKQSHQNGMDKKESIQKDNDQEINLPGQPDVTIDNKKHSIEKSDNVINSEKVNLIFTNENCKLSEELTSDCIGNSETKVTS